MRDVATIIIAILTVAGLVPVGGGEAHAAGAIAIGRCDRVGYSYNATSPAAAAQRALAECGRKGDRSCRVVVTLNRVRGAFAVAGPGGCRARGWAYAGTRAAAQDIALAQCRKHGGANCRVQAWVCDGRS